MAWLAALDRRAAAAPAAIRFPYRFLKWTLVALGAYLAIGSAWVEFHEGRLGIGLGIAVTTLLAAISGVMDAFYPPPVE